MSHRPFKGVTTQVSLERRPAELILLPRSNVVGRSASLVDLDPEYPRDRLCDLVLDLEHVDEGSVVGPRPLVVPVRGVDQLNGHADAITGAAHAAFYDSGDVELPTDPGDVPARSRHEVPGRAGLDLEQVDLAQAIDQLLADAPREIGVVATGGQVLERQHHQGCPFQGSRQALPQVGPSSCDQQRGRCCQTQSAARPSDRGPGCVDDLRNLPDKAKAPAL